MLTLISTASTTTEHGADALHTESVNQLADLMSHYGIITVVMAGFLLIVLTLVGYLIVNDRRRSKSMMDLLEHQTKSLDERDKRDQELIDRLTIEHEEKEKEAQTEKNLVAIFIRLNLVLKDECRQLQEKLNCNRVGIYVYHNGSKSLSGVPFFKTTCISEWLTRRLMVKTTLRQHTDVPLGMYYNIISDLFVDGYKIIPDRDEIKSTEPAVYEQLCKLCSRSSVIISIKNNEEAPIGGIVIEFDDNLTDKDRIDTIVATGKELSSKISLLLDYSIYSKEDIEEIQKKPFDV